MPSKADNDWAKSFASTFTLSLGLMNVVGTLYPPKKSNSGKEEKFKLACPECETATGVKQSYNCEHGHGPFANGDCGHMKELDDGTLVRVSTSELEAARTSDLNPNSLNLTVHKRDEMAGQLVRTGNSYVFRVEPPMGLPYRVLLDGIKSQPNFVFVGEVNIRKQDKFMEVSVGMNDQLIVSELAWPEDLATFKPDEYDVPPALLAQFVAITEASETEFHAENYRKESRARLAALGESGETPVAKPKKDITQDLMSVLEASLTAAKAG